MNSMRVQLQQWSRRFEARPKRERVLIAAASLALLVFIADLVVLAPLLDRLHAAARQERALIAELNALALQERELNGAALRQSEAAVETARQRVRPLLEDVNGLQATMLSSARMEDFLAGLIPRGAALRIVAMRTLPVEDVAAAIPPVTVPAPPAGSLPQGVYRHGIEIQVEGAYLELMDYVRRLEQAPWKLLLDGLSIETQQYPRALLTLRLSTFSLEPQWLQLGS